MLATRVDDAHALARALIRRQHWHEQPGLNIDPGHGGWQQRNTETCQSRLAQCLGGVATESATHLDFFLDTVRPGQPPSAAPAGVSRGHAVMLRQRIERARLAMSRYVGR